MPRVMRTRTFVGSTALACAIGWASLGAHADGLWPKLWATAPQRAERALRAGHPGRAAELFKDPRRRAYADLRAGRYAAAAKLLKRFADPQSQYNRGNALARAGDLRGALAAYDAALAKAPHDEDTIHNRDLVARALERRAGHGGKGKGRRGRAGAQRQGGSSGRAASRGGASSGGRSKGAAARGSTAQGRPGSRGESAQQQAEQARRDAQFAARLQRQAAKRGGRSRAQGAGSARGQASGAAGLLAQHAPHSGHPGEERPALSEQTLALQQWLRRIPDDPGGLLRRKFLIEHLERQQRAQEQASGEGSAGAPP